LSAPRELPVPVYGVQSIGGERAVVHHDVADAAEATAPLSGLRREW